MMNGMGDMGWTMGGMTLTWLLVVVALILGVVRLSSITLQVAATD